MSQAIIGERDSRGIGQNSLLHSGDDLSLCEVTEMDEQINDFRDELRPT